ncbi:MAG: formyltransferase family protein, partial [Bacteroidota bacterium]
MKNLNRNLILIDCPDEKGLVFRVSDILYKAGLNIESNLEFVEKNHQHFFMRTETSGEVDQRALEKELKSQLPSAARIRFANTEKKKIILFVTKEYHCLGDLIGRHHFGDLGADILAVISNREVLRDYTERFDLPFHFISSDDISREAHEQKVQQVIGQYDFDYLVLAKYMRILNPS